VAYGVAVGVDITPFLGVELTGDGHEPIVSVRGVGRVAEYAIYTVVPQIRARYPIVRGYLVPYALAGVGVSWAEINDKKPRSVQLDIDGTDYGFVGVLGAGAEYFLTRNIAGGFESKYHIIRGHEITLAGRSRSVTMDALLMSAALRIYFGAR
jgi:opacity protein-like surface antigen